jgi:hypothetical protein
VSTPGDMMDELRRQNQQNLAEMTLANHQSLEESRLRNQQSLEESRLANHQSLEESRLQNAQSREASMSMMGPCAFREGHRQAMKTLQAEHHEALRALRENNYRALYDLRERNHLAFVELCQRHGRLSIRAGEPPDILGAVAKGVKPQTGDNAELALKRAAARCEACGAEGRELFPHVTGAAMMNACLGKAFDDPKFYVALCPACEEIRLKCLGSDD